MTLLLCHPVGPQGTLVKVLRGLGGHSVQAVSVLSDLGAGRGPLRLPRGTEELFPLQGLLEVTFNAEGEGKTAAQRGEAACPRLHSPTLGLFPSALPPALIALQAANSPHCRFVMESSCLVLFRPKRGVVSVTFWQTSWDVPRPKPERRAPPWDPCGRPRCRAEGRGRRLLPSALGDATRRCADARGEALLQGGTFDIVRAPFLGVLL